MSGTATEHDAGSGDGGAQALRVMVVDDNPMWRDGVARDLADAFAGQAPAPGGPFTLGTWTSSPWGPVLEGASAWAGVRFAEPGREVGWSLLLDGVVEQVWLGESEAPLVHRRGRYVRPDGPR